MAPDDLPEGFGLEILAPDVQAHKRIDFLYNSATKFKNGQK